VKTEQQTNNRKVITESRKRKTANLNYLFPILLQILFLHKIFSDLDGIGGSTFSKVVGHDPQVQGVGLGMVPTDATHEYLILAFGINGHGVSVHIQIVLHLDPGEIVQLPSNLINIKVLLEL